MEIPFTRDQFFLIIENYNAAIFPHQLIIIVLGILSVFVLHSKIKSKNKLIGGFLGALWLWIGIAYHIAFFTEINKAAFMFGGLFMIQGLFFCVETFLRSNLQFEVTGNLMKYIGYFFIIFGMLIYPALIYFMEGSITRTISMGLPCPSTIFTFGFLMFAKPKFPKYIFIIPALWTIIGTSAAYIFGVYPDYFMLLSGFIAILYLTAIKK